MGTKQRAEDFVGWKSQDGNLEVIGIHGRDKRGVNIYNVKCHICCNDSELFGDGVFQSSKNSLVRGIKPCGCSYNPKWTPEQFLIRITRVAGDNFKIIGFAEEFKGSITNVNLSCNKCNHTWCSRVGNILTGRGCPECAKEASKLTSGIHGYYIDRVNEPDNLYILNFDNQYIKVGRAFNIDRRIKQLRRESGIENITIITTVQDTHKNIFKLEQELHEELRERGFQYELEWTTECFDMDSLKLINKLL